MLWPRYPYCVPKYSKLEKFLLPANIWGTIVEDWIQSPRILWFPPYVQAYPSANKRTHLPLGLANPLAQPTHCERISEPRLHLILGRLVENVLAEKSTDALPGLVRRPSPRCRSRCGAWHALGERCSGRTSPYSCAPRQALYAYFVSPCADLVRLSFRLLATP